MEVTSVLAQKGIETTMVMPEDRIWKRFFSATMSKFFEKYYAERGVRFAKNTKVMELKGAGAVQSAVLQSGEILDCDTAVAGIGVTPITEPLLKSGIELKDGVVVNEYLETNRSDILAAGDVASYYDVLFDKHRRAEHWDNAVSQGQHCARALLGERSPFIHVPYFFSDVFDLSYEFWGDPSGAEEIIERGDLSSSSFRPMSRPGMPIEVYGRPSRASVIEIWHASLLESRRSATPRSSRSSSMSPAGPTSSNDSSDT